MTFNNKKWLKSKKILLRQLKKQVHMILGEESEDLIEYGLRYKSEFNGNWEMGTSEDFYESVNSSKIILGGDFHPYSQAQRTHLRILRSIDKPLILALECFESKYQNEINDFVSQKISEEKFLELISWESHWSFPWENYRPIVQYAIDHQIPIYGINKAIKIRSNLNLDRRDQHSAEQLSKIRATHKDEIIYVIYGDLHLATQSLYKQIKSNSILRNDKILQVFLNSEKLYFRFAPNTKNSSTIIFLKKGKRKFCLLSSAPWVKWQSYLMYLEQTFDREFEDESDGIDYTDHMAKLIKIAIDDLELNISTSNIAAYGPGEDEFFLKAADNLTKSDYNIVFQLTENDRSVYLPEIGAFYISRPSINHGASLAGQYIQSVVSERDFGVWQMPSDFVGSIWINALSFFISKLINPHRKSESLEKIQQELEAKELGDQIRQIFMLVLDQSLREAVFCKTGRKRKLKEEKRKKIVYFESSLILGNMLGEKIFQIYRQNLINKKDAINMLALQINQKFFEKRYFQCIEYIDELLNSSLKNIKKIKKPWEPL